MTNPDRNYINNKLLLNNKKRRSKFETIHHATRPLDSLPKYFFHFFSYISIEQKIEVLSFNSDEYKLETMCGFFFGLSLFLFFFL